MGSYSGAIKGVGISEQMTLWQQRSYVYHELGRSSRSEETTMGLDTAIVLQKKIISKVIEEAVACYN